MKSQILIFSLVVVLFFGCKKESDEPTKKPLSIPTEYGYDSVSFQNNASQALNYANVLVDFENELKKGRNISYLLEKSQLDSMFQILRPITPQPIQPMIDNYINEIVLASGKTFDPNNPTPEGGIYGGYIYNKEGLDLHELIIKTIWGVAFIQQMNNISSNANNVNQVDPLLVYYGAHPYFKNSSDASKHGIYADKFSANYAARRDNNDGNGFYHQIKKNFLKLKAAISAGEPYQTEKQDAIKSIFENIEKAYAATIINYCFSAISKLNLSNPTENDFSSAIHAIGEAIAFTTNIKNMNQKKLSVSDIDFIFNQLNYQPTTQINKFVTETFNQLPKLNNIIQRIKSVYGFSDSEIEDFKKNWIQVQNR